MMDRARISLSALVLVLGFAPAAQAHAAFDYASLEGAYVSSECLAAPGADGQAQPGQPIPAWDGTKFQISAENGGLHVSTPGANVPDYFDFAFPRMNQGPQAVSQSSPGMGMSMQGTSTAVTLANGVQVTVDREISTPISSGGGFVDTATLTETADGLVYKIVQKSPDSGVGSNVTWVEWRSCLLKRAN